MQAIPWFINEHPDVQAYWLSRINTVTGLTQEHVSKWGWNINDRGWVNFPDVQTTRSLLYCNVPGNSSNCASLEILFPRFSNDSLL